MEIDITPESSPQRLSFYDPSPLSNRSLLDTSTASPIMPNGRPLSAVNNNRESQTNGTKSSNFNLETKNTVNVLECSTFPSSSSLLAYGEDAYFTVIQRRLPTQNEVNTSQSRSSELNFHHVAKVYHGARVECFAWSSLSVADPNIDNTRFSLCTAGGDKQIRYFDAKARDSEPKQVVIGQHDDYINGCAFSKQKQSFNILATVGDDRTCRLWDISTQQPIESYRLKSPGVSVCFHEQSDLLLVAEQNGMIRFYDRRMSNPTSSMQTDCFPLLDADWCPVDPLRFGAVSQKNWFIWTLPKSSQKLISLETGVAHQEGCKKIRFSPVSRNLFATSGQINNINVWDIAHPTLPFTFGQKSCRVGGLSWFMDNINPVCVTGADRKLNFWFLR